MHFLQEYYTKYACKKTLVKGPNFFIFQISSKQNKIGTVT